MLFVGPLSAVFQPEKSENETKQYSDYQKHLLLAPDKDAWTQDILGTPAVQSSLSSVVPWTPLPALRTLSTSKVLPPLVFSLGEAGRGRLQ